MLRISKSVSCVLQIPVLSISCQEAMTLVIKPCALIPNSVHMCCTLVPRMLYYPSHGTDCPKCGKVLRLPLRPYRLYNQLSWLWFDRSGHWLLSHISTCTWLASCHRAATPISMCPFQWGCCTPPLMPQAIFRGQQFLVPVLKSEVPLGRCKSACCQCSMGLG